jgi:hypothetical protein
MKNRVERRGRKGNEKWKMKNDQWRISKTESRKNLLAATRHQNLQKGFLSGAVSNDQSEQFLPAALTALTMR